MHGTIGKQMIDTLVESQANVEVSKCEYELMNRRMGYLYYLA